MIYVIIIHIIGTVDWSNGNLYVIIWMYDGFIVYVNDNDIIRHSKYLATCAVLLINIRIGFGFAVVSNLYSICNKSWLSCGINDEYADITDAICEYSTE